MNNPIPKPWSFRLRRKLGQFYVNIPGIGSTAVEANPDKPDCLNEALKAAKKAFMRVYEPPKPKTSPKKVVRG